ncbi:protein tyrosine kinase 7 [Haematobia irritans]|uniref:protein tyrosine kinase 7 n=1 Tax=Haematobia irritans TaxID=7368 RepID=UPI003F4F665D
MDLLNMTKAITRIASILLIICSWNAVCLAETSSRFLILPVSQSIAEGDTADFNCHATPTRGLIYSWTLNGQLIQNSSRIYQNGSDLHIESVSRESDGGDYVCIATNVANGARQASPPARLTVIWIQTANVQLLANYQHEVILKCHVEASSGDGLLEIEWFRNSEKLSSLKNIELQENRLIIRNPTGQDTGLYRCIASNAAGRVMSRKGYILKWSSVKDSTNCMPRLKKNYIMPDGMKDVFLCRGKRGDNSPSLANDDKLPLAEDVQITKGPLKRATVKENDVAELFCQYAIAEKYLQAPDGGSSEIILRWRKDGKIIRQIELNNGASAASSSVVQRSLDANKDPMLREDTRVSIAKDNGSLVFASVIASDAGQYVCQVVVEGYRPISSEPGELQVIEQLKFMPQPTSKNLELGSVGKVHCKAQGTPVPQVKWLKDLKDDLPDTLEDINGTLTFKNVTSEHRGNYTCVAINSQGQINATVSINVVVAPRFLVAPEGPIESMESGVAIMHCQATGDPKPTIQWDKDLQYLSENNTDRLRFHFLENGTLEIRNVQPEDEGSYGCTIGNSAGLKREEVRFIVKSAGDVEVEPQEGFLITRAVLITMSVAFAYIILVVGLMVWCRYRRQARKARLNEGRDNPEAGEGEKNAEHEPCLSESKSAKIRKTNGNNNPNKANGNTDPQKSDDTACSNHSKTSKKSNVYDQLSFPRSGITEMLQVGRGEFGDVFVGKIKSNLIKTSEDKDTDTEKNSNSNSDNGNGSAATTSTTVEKRRSKTSMDDIEEIKEEQETCSSDNDTNTNGTTTEEYKLVMVKALNKIKDETACQEFRRQIEMFRTLTHKGVVRLFGLCREKDPHYMVLEYTDWGDLKQFLLATAGKVNTSTNSSSPPPLQTGQVLAVAYQIARGMDAIYRARFIHKDLATRNCIISSDFIVKVSYPALCKDKYNREYFKHRNTLLPIRWLAPECVQEDEYTTKSDIFAFGVVVWELFTQATKIPHEDLSNEEVIQRSQAGKLEWQCAEATPDSLKEILSSCWNVNPKERPSFSQLGSALSKTIQSLDK